MWTRKVSHGTEIARMQLALFSGGDFNGKDIGANVSMRGTFENFHADSPHQCVMNRRNNLMLRRCGSPKPHVLVRLEASFPA